MPTENLPDASQTGQAAGSILYWMIGTFSAAAVAIHQALRKTPAKREEVDFRSTTIEVIDSERLRSSIDALTEAVRTLLNRGDLRDERLSDINKKFDDVLRRMHDDEIRREERAKALAELGRSRET